MCIRDRDWDDDSADLERRRPGGSCQHRRPGRAHRTRSTQDPRKRSAESGDWNIPLYVHCRVLRAAGLCLARVGHQSHPHKLAKVRDRLVRSVHSRLPR